MNPAQFIEKYYKWLLLAIPLISLVMHLHVFSLDLVGYHVWRQTQTQTVIDNFHKEDMSILNPRINAEPDTDRIRRMEFPLMQWFFALFYKILGNHLIISRLLSFIIGLFSIYGIYRVCGVLFRSKTAATLGAWTFCFSPVFYYYTVNPLPDNLALCCCIWMLVYLFRYYDSGKLSHVILSSVFLCIAALVKLPFIVYGAGIICCLLVALRKGRISTGRFLGLCALCILLIAPAFAWYAWVIPTWQGNGVVTGMLDNQQGVGKVFGFIQGHLVSTLPEMLVNYGAIIFFLAGFYFMFVNRVYRDSRWSILVAVAAGVTGYFLFEINLIEAVHDYYLFPFLPLIFLIVTYGAYHLSHQRNLLRYITVLALLVLPVTAFLRANPRWNTEAPGFNPAYYQYKADIRILLPKDAIVVTGNSDNHFVPLYYIDRKGWTYNNDQLDEGLLQFYMSHRAAYLFADGSLDKNDWIQPYLSNKIFDKGTLRVYQLKHKQ